jgi:omega-hydroxy-beta-dihydromenaquinone-9 sulfotransferase
LQLFPKARFVHLHRDPYELFQSSRHYFETAAWYANLQILDPAAFDEQILRRYRVLYDVFLEQRSLVPAGRFHELAYDSLVNDPLGELERMYTSLGLGSFANARPQVQSYLNFIENYQTNRYRPLGEPDRRRVADAWGKYFQAFGYPLHSESFAASGSGQEAHT